MHRLFGKSLIFLSLILSAALFAGIAAAQENGERTPIYPHLGAQLIDMGEVLVIDVRSDEEVEDTGVLADAEHVEHTDTEGLMEVIGDDKARTVVLYCGSGRRAGMAIAALEGEGYMGLVNAGGYEDLEAALNADDDNDEE